MYIVNTESETRTRIHSSIWSWRLLKARTRIHCSTSIWSRRLLEARTRIHCSIWIMESETVRG